MSDGRESQDSVNESETEVTGSVRVSPQHHTFRAHAVSVWACGSVGAWAWVSLRVCTHADTHSHSMHPPPAHLPHRQSVIVL